MARASMTLCAGGAIVGNLPARPVLMFVPRPGLQPSTRAVHLPEDVLPPDSQTGDELLIVSAEKYRSIMEAAEYGSTNSDDDAREACFTIASLARTRFKDAPRSEDAPPTPQQALELILEEQARELTRSGFNEVAAILMTTLAAMRQGTSLRDLAVAVINANRKEKGGIH